MKNLMRAQLPAVPQEDKDKLIASQIEHIKNLCNPTRILLFGSAVSGKFDLHSDLDFVLIFPTLEEAKKAQTALYRSRKPSPADYVCVEATDYERRSLIGGVLFVARTEGVELSP